MHERNRNRNAPRSNRPPSTHRQGEGGRDRGSRRNNDDNNNNNKQRRPRRDQRSEDHSIRDERHSNSRNEDRNYSSSRDIDSSSRVDGNQQKDLPKCACGKTDNVRECGACYNLACSSCAGSCAKCKGEVCKCCGFVCTGHPDTMLCADCISPCTICNSMVCEACVCTHQEEVVCKTCRNEKEGIPPCPKCRSSPSTTSPIHKNMNAGMSFVHWILRICDYRVWMCSYAQEEECFLFDTWIRVDCNTGL